MEQKQNTENTKAKKKMQNKWINEWNGQNVGDPKNVMYMIYLFILFFFGQ